MCDNNPKRNLKTNQSKKTNNNKDMRVSVNLVEVTQSLNEMALEENSPELNDNNNNLREGFDSFKDLPNYFQYIDDKYFNGKLTENGVQVKWSDKMTVRYAQTHPPKDGKPIEIRLSRKLLGSRPGIIVCCQLGKEMQKAYELITKLGDKNSINSLENSSAIDPKPEPNEGLSRSEWRTVEERLEIDVDLQNLFHDFDERYLDGVLIKNGVGINWSEDLGQYLSASGIEDGKHQIRVSKQLMFSSPKELAETILGQMIRTCVRITNRSDTAYRSELMSRVLNESTNININIDFDTSAEQNSKEKPQELDTREESKLDQDQWDQRRRKIKEIESHSIVDQRLESLDPKPDIQDLFRLFDERFFCGVLIKNEVEICWSDRQTVSAGITYAQTEGKPIIIRLNRRLLGCGSRRQLVETLLHEMIHSYMMVFRIDPGANGGHGPEFIRMMEDLNAETGANITVYHYLVYDLPEYLRRVKEDRNRRQLKFGANWPSIGLNV